MEIYGQGGGCVFPDGAVGGMQPAGHYGRRFYFRALLRVPENGKEPGGVSWKVVF